MSDADKDDKRKMAKEYREKIESELKTICDKVLALLKDHLIPKIPKPAGNEDGNADSYVFYLKMKGDYLRYIAEVVQDGDEKTKVTTLSKDAYQEALDCSKLCMSPTNPIHLGLALNYSVFYYEILSEPDQACKLAKVVRKNLLLIKC